MKAVGLGYKEPIALGKGNQERGHSGAAIAYGYGDSRPY